jgi:hypothetical protein
MKKTINFIILSAATFCCAIAHSQNVEEINPGYILLDIVLYRPAGFVVTVIGAGVFIGVSPLTALSSIPAPHDAFVKTGNILVMAPGAYTFVRPLGRL